jgi:N-acetylglucosamine-6-phosphate deacetylase
MTSTFAIRGNLLMGTRFEPGTLVVEDGLIVEMVRGSVSNGNLPSSVLTADLVTPGLIDMQVNGAIGLEIAHDPRNYERISAWSVQSGVTSWLPTVVTAAADFYPDVFAAWRDVDASVGAVPLGFHLEGPFLSPARKGAHQLRYIEAAPEDIFQAWLEQDSIRLVTLAPEREGAHAHIRALAERGILVSLGHTDATYDQLVSGLDQGALMATHLFNAMSPMHHRNPGAMIATMTDSRVTAGLIPDAIHSHPAAVRLAFAAKGPDGIAIVTDMMSATGLGPGTYELGGQPVEVTSSTAKLADGTLAGAILTMDEAVKNMSQWGGATTAEAFHMATQVPARLLGDHTRGKLGVGCRADIALWSTSLAIQQTIVNGHTAWSTSAT